MASAATLSEEQRGLLSEGGEDRIWDNLKASHHRVKIEARRVPLGTWLLERSDLCNCNSRWRLLRWGGSEGRGTWGSTDCNPDPLQSVAIHSSETGWSKN